MKALVFLSMYLSENRPVSKLHWCGEELFCQILQKQEQKTSTSTTQLQQRSDLATTLLLWVKRKSEGRGVINNFPTAEWMILRNLMNVSVILSGQHPVGAKTIRICYFRTMSWRKRAELQIFRKVINNSQRKIPLDVLQPIKLMI